MKALLAARTSAALCWRFARASNCRRVSAVSSLISRISCSVLRIRSRNKASRSLRTRSSASWFAGLVELELSSEEVESSESDSDSRVPTSTFSLRRFRGHMVMSAVRRSDVARNLPRDSTYSRFSLSPPSPLHTHACDQMGGGRSAQATHLVEEIGVCSGRLCQGHVAWRGGKRATRRRGERRHFALDNFARAIAFGDCVTGIDSPDFPLIRILRKLTRAEFARLSLLRRNRLIHPHHDSWR